MELETLQTERLTDTIRQLLRTRIITGAFRPGEKINVDVLAQQLGVSQTPVKGALALLAAESLVEVRPRRGTFVSEISERSLVETFAIRLALELLAAETIIDNASPADLRELYRLVQQIQDATDVESHYRRNSAFHQRLVALSGNSRLVQLYQSTDAHTQIALIHGRSSDWKSRAESEAAEHRELVEMIERRDKDALREGITRHVTRARESLLADLRLRAG